MEMYISLAISAVLSRPETCRSTSCSRSVSGSTTRMAGLIWGALRSRELMVGQGWCEQTPVGVGQFGVTAGAPARSSRAR